MPHGCSAGTRCFIDSTEEQISVIVGHTFCKQVGELDLAVKKIDQWLEHRTESLEDLLLGLSPAFSMILGKSLKIKLMGFFPYMSFLLGLVV